MKSAMKIFTAAAFAALITFGCASKDADERVLDRLRVEGIDLTKPHTVDFFLFFGKEEDARKTADQIKALGFQIDIQKPAGSAPNWLCHASKSMLPDLASFRQIRLQFDRIATSQNGVYDGWSIAAVP